MGPPRSGAGVGIGMLRGFVVFWKSQRFKKCIFPKYQDSTTFHADPKFREKGRYIFENIFDSFGLLTFLNHARIFNSF